MGDPTPTNSLGPRSTSSMKSALDTMALASVAAELSPQYRETGTVFKRLKRSLLPLEASVLAPSPGSNSCKTGLFFDRVHPPGPTPAFRHGQSRLHRQVIADLGRQSGRSISRADIRICRSSGWPCIGPAPPRQAHPRRPEFSLPRKHLNGVPSGRNR